MGSVETDRLLVRAAESFNARDFDAAIAPAEQVLQALPGNQRRHGRSSTKARQRKNARPQFEVARQRAIVALDGKRSRPRRGPPSRRCDRSTRSIRPSRCSTGGSRAGRRAPPKEVGESTNPGFSALEDEPGAAPPGALLRARVAPPEPPTSGGPRRPQPRLAFARRAARRARAAVPAARHRRAIPRRGRCRSTSFRRRRRAFGIRLRGAARTCGARRRADAGARGRPDARWIPVGLQHGARAGARRRARAALAAAGDRVAARPRRRGGAGGNRQQAIEIWSRIFLIDINNSDAVGRIEKARQEMSEGNRRVAEASEARPREVRVGRLHRRPRGVSRGARPRRDRRHGPLLHRPHRARARAAVGRPRPRAARPRRATSSPRRWPRPPSPSSTSSRPHAEPSGRRRAPARARARRWTAVSSSRSAAPSCSRSPSARYFLLRGGGPGSRRAAAAGGGPSLEHATALFRDGKVAETIAELKQISPEHPDYARAQKLLASLSRQERRRRDAGGRSADAAGGARGRRRRRPDRRPRPSHQREEAEKALAEKRYIDALKDFNLAALGVSRRPDLLAVARRGVGEGQRADAGGQALQRGRVRNRDPDPLADLSRRTATTRTPARTCCAATTTRASPSSRTASIRRRPRASRRSSRSSRATRTPSATRSSPSATSRATST